jgi:twitching motility protein PilT
MNITDILIAAKEEGASDIHLVAGKPPIFRVNGILKDMPGVEARLMPLDVKELGYSILNEDQEKRFEKDNELDFSFGISGVGRYRVNLHVQRGTIGASIRSLNTEIPHFSKLGLPEVVNSFTEYENGLILVTGPTGSGKSTTLASLIDKINKEKPCHIITIEDPIEYLHSHKKALVEQRELKSDTASFATALKYALRQDPDVILIGEMRDLDTIGAALTAAETGHLVFGTLHTNNAAKTIDRIIDVFPMDQQSQVRIQLSTSLKGVLAQQLIPSTDNKRVAACEIMVGTPAIANLIRENKTYQIPSMIETGMRFGMVSMDAFLEKLLKKGKISKAEFEKRSSVKKNKMEF